MHDLASGFIITGNKIITLNHPEFSTIIGEVVTESSARFPRLGGVSANVFPSWFQASENPEKQSNLVAMESELSKKPFQTPASQNRMRNTLSELKDRSKSHDEKPNKEQIGSDTSASDKQTPQKSRIPDRKTRRMWISKYFQSFLDWKRSGQSEQERPVIKVSTWTQETVYNFFEFLFDKRSSKSSDTAESTEDQGSDQYQFRLKNNGAVASLFERKMSSTKRMKRQKHSTDSEPDSEEDVSEQRMRRIRDTGHGMGTKMQKHNTVDPDSISESDAFRHSTR